MHSAEAECDDWRNALHELSGTLEAVADTIERDGVTSDQAIAKADLLADDTIASVNEVTDDEQIRPIRDREKAGLLKKCHDQWMTDGLDPTVGQRLLTTLEVLRSIASQFKAGPLLKTTHEAITASLRQDAAFFKATAEADVAASEPDRRRRWALRLLPFVKELRRIAENIDTNGVTPGNRRLALRLAHRSPADSERNTVETECPDTAVELCNAWRREAWRAYRFHTDVGDTLQHASHILTSEVYFFRNPDFGNTSDAPKDAAEIVNRLGKVIKRLEVVIDEGQLPASAMLSPETLEHFERNQEAKAEKFRAMFKNVVTSPARLVQAASALRGEGLATAKAGAGDIQSAQAAMPNPSNDKSSQPSGEAQFAIWKDGNVWQLHGFGESAKFGDLKGFADIHRILSSPNKSALLVELTGELADERLANEERSQQPAIEKNELRKLNELINENKADLDSAKANNDLAEIARIEEEQAWLIKQVKAMTNVHGEPRDLNANNKRRSRVWDRIQKAIGKLPKGEPSMPKLAEHLQLCIRCEGDSVRYLDPSGIVWKTERSAI